MADGPVSVFGVLGVAGILSTKVRRLARTGPLDRPRAERRRPRRGLSARREQEVTQAVLTEAYGGALSACGPGQLVRVFSRLRGALGFREGREWLVSHYVFGPNR